MPKKITELYDSKTLPVRTREVSAMRPLTRALAVSRVRAMVPDAERAGEVFAMLGLDPAAADVAEVLAAREAATGA